MRKLGLALSIVFMASVVTGVGAGAYYTTLYFKRGENHRFEAAYIYDTTFVDSVNVDLGVINPSESVTQAFPVISLLNKTIDVVISFSSKSEEAYDYIAVLFDDEEQATTLDEYIKSGKQYKFSLGHKEARNVFVTYTMDSDITIESDHSIDFAINLKAFDKNYEW